ncbi:hypothetical protein PVAP13_6KG186106 [Panicum virgatum]|uniref:Uncharacterized protein n=1 Tax=Panicum virgatum TaxID=38727 RepID=A0A8T0RBM9_PANVG|nr:hypothetical protein PVAP13_6KG186106 [Panicum virgatum]
MADACPILHAGGGFPPIHPVLAFSTPLVSPPTDLWRRCFRCLTLDHKLERCRDPVRCRRCWAFDHTERYYKWRPSPLSPVPSSAVPLRSSVSSTLPSLACSASMADSHSTARSAGGSPMASDADSAPAFIALLDYSFVMPSPPCSSSLQDLLGEETPPGSPRFFFDAPLRRHLFFSAPSSPAVHPSPHAPISPVGAALDEVDLVPPQRPDHVDAYMPFVAMRRYANIAFANISPPAAAPSAFLRRAFQSVAGNPHVRLAPSSHGAQIVIFDDEIARDSLVHHSPFFFRNHAITLERFDETPNRFLFQHEAFVALSIEDYPLEHWRREHIMHSVTPFGNPHFIDLICLMGSDYSAVLVVVKVESINDIPLHIHFKNYDGPGSIGTVHIIHFEEADLDSYSDSDRDDPLPPPFFPGRSSRSRSIEQGPFHSFLAPLPTSPHFLPSGASSGSPPHTQVFASPITGRPVVQIRASPTWFKISARGRSAKGGPPSGSGRLAGLLGLGSTAGLRACWPGLADAAAPLGLGSAVASAPVPEPVVPLGPLPACDLPGQELDLGPGLHAVQAIPGLAALANLHVPCGPAPLLWQGPRIAANEDAFYISPIDKASCLKKRKLEGIGHCPVRAPAEAAVLPRELLELASAGDFPEPLRVADLCRLGLACEVLVRDLDLLDSDLGSVIDGMGGAN